MSRAALKHSPYQRTPIHSTSYPTAQDREMLDLLDASLLRSTAPDVSRDGDRTLLV